MSSNSENVPGFQPARLTIAREQSGISQRELGRRLGLGPSQINRYENGLTDPSTPILTAMAQQLEVSTDYLLGLSEFPKNYPSLDLLPEERRLLDAFKAGDGVTAMKLLVDHIRKMESEAE